MRYEWGLGIGHAYSWKGDHGEGTSVGSLGVEEPEVDEQTGTGSVSLGTRAEDDLAEDCLEDMENEVLSDGESDGDEEGSDSDHWVDEEAGSNDEEYWYI